jgi:uncharacterized RDD family membrane protein YckC
MSNDNPYASPETLGSAGYGASAAGVDVSQGNLANKKQRFVNFIIDRLATWACEFMVGMAFAIVAVASGNDEWVDSLDGGVGILLSIGVTLLYYIVMEAMFGRTLGKLITRTVVVTDDGRPLTVGKAIGRSFARLIPFEPFSTFGLPGNVPWHDRLSGTRVVRVSR